MNLVTTQPGELQNTEAGSSHSDWDLAATQRTPTNMSINWSFTGGVWHSLFGHDGNATNSTYVYPA
jgi:hypothetical protein